MSRVTLEDVQRRVRTYTSWEVDQLVEAAACVANAVHAGGGSAIKGSLMEKELRDVLGLEEGDVVLVDKKLEEK